MNSLTVLLQPGRPFTNSELSVLLWLQRPLLTSLCSLFQSCLIRLGGFLYHQLRLNGPQLHPGALQCHLFSMVVICSAGKRASVQRESELGVRGPE